MKRWFIVSILFTLLGGCVVTPVGYRYHDGYRDYDQHRDHDYRGGWGYHNHEQP